MTKQTLNIEIGKGYSASYLLNEIRNFPSRIQIGHAITKARDRDRHLYHVSEEELERLKDTELRVLSIINPCEQNFAHKLIFSPETQENLKKIKAQKGLCYAVDMNDLMQVGYRFKGVNSAIHCMNCVFERNELPFKASPHSEGKIDRKHFVKISYRQVDKEMNKNCEIVGKQNVSK